MNWLKEKGNLKTILKVIGVIVAINIVAGVIEAFIPDDKPKLLIFTIWLPVIVIISYAYFMARKEDYLGLKVVFIFLLLNEILKIIGRII